MISYSYKYQHGTKEIILTLQIGTTPPMNAMVSAEAFLQDIDFMLKDKKLAHFLAEVKRRKDLPIDYDFGDNAEIKFDPEAWERIMKRDDKKKEESNDEV